MKIKIFNTQKEKIPEVELVTESHQLNISEWYEKSLAGQNEKGEVCAQISGL